VECGILSRAMEFACFRGISTFLWNSLLASDNETKTAYFGRVQVAQDYYYNYNYYYCRHDFAMKYMSAVSTLT